MSNSFFYQGARHYGDRHGMVPLLHRQTSARTGELHVKKQISVTSHGIVLLLARTR